MSRKRFVARVVVLVIAAASMFLSGCASAVKYKFSKDLQVSDRCVGECAVVDVFNDKRVEQERQGANRGRDGFSFTNDKNFKPDIPKQISVALADHLQKANVFHKAVVRDIDDDLENNAAEIAALRNEGFQYAVSGDLSHFYGYVSGAASSMTAGVLFGAIGAITEGLINPKFVGGEVVYKDVKIIDLNKGTLAWKGDIEDSFEEKSSFPDGQVIYSLRALKEANNKLVHVFKENSNI